MYIGYINDQKKLGFSCIKDMAAAKQLSNLTDNLKNPIILIITKGKKTLLSKETYFAGLIFLQSIPVMNIDADLYHQSFSFSKIEVHRFSVSKYNNLGFLNSYSNIADCVLTNADGFKSWIEEIETSELEMEVKLIAPLGMTINGTVTLKYTSSLRPKDQKMAKEDNSPSQPKKSKAS